MPNLTEAQKVDLDAAQKRLMNLFQKASDMAEAETDNKALYEQLIASTDRLREEIAIANIILAKLESRA